MRLLILIEILIEILGSPNKRAGNPRKSKSKARKSIINPRTSFVVPRPAGRPGRHEPGGRSADPSLGDRETAPGSAAGRLRTTKEVLGLPRIGFL